MCQSHSSIYCVDQSDGTQLLSHWESDELIFSQTRVRVKRCYTLWVLSVCLLRDNPSSQTKKQSWDFSFIIPACCLCCRLWMYTIPAARPERVHSIHHHHRSYWLSLIFLIFNLSPTSCTMFVQSPGKSCITTYIITESGRVNRFLPASTCRLLSRVCTVTVLG